MAEQQRFFFLDLKTPGIVLKGGSAKKGHEDWIEPDSWDFSMSQSAEPNVKGGRPDKTSAVGTFSFTIKHNGPALFKHCSNGWYIDKPITFEADRGGLQVASGPQQRTTGTYFRLVFDRSVITGRSISGGDGQKTESISLAFQKVSMTYCQVVNGQLVPVATKWYDSKSNQAG